MQGKPKVLTYTHNVCFKQSIKHIKIFLVKFSIFTAEKYLCFFAWASFRNVMIYLRLLLLHCLVNYAIFKQSNILVVKALLSCGNLLYCGFVFLLNSLLLPLLVFEEICCSYRKCYAKGLLKNHVKTFDV